MRGLYIGDHAAPAHIDSHPSWVAAHGCHKQFRFAGASAIGKTHLKKFTSRDDAFAIATAGEWMTMAVSDGVGSQPYSRYGSSLAVEAFCINALWAVPRPEMREDTDLQIAVARRDGVTAPALRAFVELPDRVGDGSTLTWHWNPPVHRPVPAELDARASSLDDVMRDSVYAARTALEQFAARHCLGSIRDLSCTFLAALWNTSTEELGLAHIGDGAILMRQGTAFDVLAEAPQPEKAGDSYTICHEEWEQRVVFEYQGAEHVDALFLMTDGVGDYLSAGPAPFARFGIDPEQILRGGTNGPARLLHALAAAETEPKNDDRTLVVVWR